MIRVKIAPRKQNAPRPAWKVADAFRQWLRGRPCACNGAHDGCGGFMESAHVDYAATGTPDAKGMGSKVADRWCIPLSANCHRLQHNKGWPWFEQHILGGLGRAELMAAEYWRLWPARGQWERDHA